MAAYTLKNGEEQLLTEARVSDRTKDNTGMATGELVLTTEALVYNKKGAFGKDLGYDVYPLAEILVADGEPQVKVGTRLGLKNLEIHLADERVVRFGLGSDNSAKRVQKWVDAIKNTITGQET